MADVNLDEVLAAARALGAALRNPALAKVEGMAETLASLANRKAELEASVTSLEAKQAALKKQIESESLEVGRMKQDAIDDIRVRQKAHEELCQGLTVKAQKEVERIEAAREDSVRKHATDVAAHKARIEELKAEKAGLESAVSELHANVSEARSKFASLLA